MGDAARKDDRLYIPQRDKNVVAKANPAMSEHCNHRDQVMNAFVHGFARYHNALKELSKV